MNRRCAPAIHRSDTRSVALGASLLALVFAAAAAPAGQASPAFAADGARPRAHQDPAIASAASRIRLYAALDLLDPSSPQTAAAALDALGALAREPWNEVVAIAKMTQAAILARQGSDDLAHALMSEALAEWQDRQPTSGPADLPADVVRDVADIHRQVFEGGEAPWEWRQHLSRTAPPRYLVVHPDVTVGIGDAPLTRAHVYPPFESTNVLFIDTDQMSLLVGALGRLISRPASGVPAGPVPPDLHTFLMTYFTVRQGPFGGLESFVSIPTVSSVRFTDETRTRAVVAVRASASGGNLLMDKREGVWRAAGVGVRWIQ